MKFDIGKVFGLFFGAVYGFFRDIKSQDPFCQAGKKKRVVAIAGGHIDDGVLFLDERFQILVDEGVVIHNISLARYRFCASACRYR